MAITEMGDNLFVPQVRCEHVRRQRQALVLAREILLHDHYVRLVDISVDKLQEMEEFANVSVRLLHHVVVQEPVESLALKVVGSKSTLLCFFWGTLLASWFTNHALSWQRLVL